MALPSSFHEAGGIVSRAEKPALSFHNPSPPIGGTPLSLRGELRGTSYELRVLSYEF